MAPITLEPIGLWRTPFPDRLSAPRQPRAALGVEGRIELFPGRGLEHAVCDLETWDRIWVLFHFHLNDGWRPKVLPPRSSRRRGVLATRSPHRPNPIGMSAVKLLRVSGLVLEVEDVDAVDQTPVLDIKPYVAYTDSYSEAGTGWLTEDPVSPFEVAWSPAAHESARWIADRIGFDLASSVERVLRLGPEPHPYRRIRNVNGALVLAVKDWRIRFTADVPNRKVSVSSVHTGYKPSELALTDDPLLRLHQEFVTRFARWASVLVLGLFAPTVARAEPPATHGDATPTVVVDAQSARAAPEAESQNASALPRPGAADATRGDTMRTVGFFVGAAGVVAFGTGAFAGLRALSLWNEAQTACPHDRCLSEAGREKGEEAGRWADASTFLLGSGVAFGAAGVALWFLAPRIDAKDRPMVGGSFDSRGATITVGGAF